MQQYWHSVVLDKTLCCGCTNCLDRCPTQAIRVIDGKARIINDRCTDCGECIKVCPYHAKGALTEDLDSIKPYKYTVAIPSIAIYGQFPLSFEPNRILNGFLKLGFDDVYDSAFAADCVTAKQSKYLKENRENRPLISTACPAIIRLIQIRYPSLLDNIMPVEAPMEVAARLARQKAMAETNYSEDEIGVFFISQCPAKITSVQMPIGIVQSAVSGVIAINKIFAKLLKAVEETTDNLKDLRKGSAFGIGWGRVSGQSYALGLDNYLGVDGIQEVIKILDKIELGKLPGIDFFEGYACVTGCVGGPLNVENAFIAKSRIAKLGRSEIALSKDLRQPMDQLEAIYDSAGIEFNQEIEARQVMKLDVDFRKAMEKMSKIEETMRFLPQIDCGACGSPTCRALAEDIVQGTALLECCVVRNYKPRGSYETK